MINYKAVPSFPSILRNRNIYMKKVCINEYSNFTCETLQDRHFRLNHRNLTCLNVTNNINHNKQVKNYLQITQLQLVVNNLAPKQEENYDFSVNDDIAILKLAEMHGACQHKRRETEKRRSRSEQRFKLVVGSALCTDLLGSID